MTRLWLPANNLVFLTGFMAESDGSHAELHVVCALAGAYLAGIALVNMNSMQQLLVFVL
jgi:hypothetical protein